MFNPCLIPLFIIITSSIVSVQDLPFNVCSHSFIDNATCVFKDIHHNKTHFEFNAIIGAESHKVQINNSTFPKLGRYGFCRSPLNWMESSNVYELNLTNATIEEIHEDAFEGCVRMTTIILRNNKIKVLENGLFNRNRKLEKIDLTNNLIVELPSDAFDHLDKLKDLLLADNHLKLFSANLVKTCPNLGVLRLESNDLLELNSRKLVEFLPKLEKVTFNNNQFRCARVKNITGAFKKEVIDYAFEGVARERIKPTETVEAVMCLEDNYWAVVHYIYMYTKSTDP